ncbi:precorrin-2 C(20)-methyltransferase [Thermodesulforhabdus norvegica]|uniref:Precorrin-2/cobalt-factor-2 C20-methyltransferase n=1 Tax=Thermodesulforhabdus norvegica TaxID=39841 RepID=A0A1I4T6G6_9BACT|nr:precorrin-2 C(20)-methyltransferase [Thermodesulforhabdus norvegica]SFM72157.1 precorrin-2/cobalt-factor-2 C20-methyltransferase [Thermodesulforhabdus norvegica]
MVGTFYGIGVGPGDPELITVKAVRILNRVSYIFAAASSKNSYSLALDIVKPYLPPETPVEYLYFPMTYHSDTLENSWHKNGLRVAEVLRSGKDVAFVTLGDPLIYSTYIYLVRELYNLLGSVKIETVPGITSFQAAASACTVPLVEGEESLAVVSGAQGGEHLRRMLEVTDNVVLLKVYRNIDAVIDALESQGLEKNACFVSRCGLEGESISYDVRSLRGQKPHYLSLMIVKKKLQSVSASDLPEVSSAR